MTIVFPTSAAVYVYVMTIIAFEIVGWSASEMPYAIVAISIAAIAGLTWWYSPLPDGTDPDNDKPYWGWFDEDTQ